MKSYATTVSHLISSAIANANDGNLVVMEDLLLKAEEMVAKLSVHRQPTPNKLIALLRKRMSQGGRVQTSFGYSQKPRVYQGRCITELDNDTSINIAQILANFTGNEYQTIERREHEFLLSGTLQPVSIVIPVYNRPKILGMTLAAILHQSYPKHLIEVIVVDDGSREDTMKIIRRFQGILNIVYYWQQDQGYRPGQARTAGMRLASTENIITLDCDMLPTRDLVAEYMYVLNRKRDSILIGPRKYVCTDHLTVEDLINSPYWIDTLPEVISNNSVAAVNQIGKTVDWRHSFYKRTDFLKRSIFPFIAFASGNVAYPKRAFEITGGYDPVFEKWGSEDTEFGYRLFAEGYYIEPIMAALALHQEPPGGENEVDRESGHVQTREILKEKCPLFSREYVEGRSYPIPKYCFINLTECTADEFEKEVNKFNYSDCSIDTSGDAKSLFQRTSISKSLINKVLEINPAAFFVFVKKFDANIPLLFDFELTNLDVDLRETIANVNAKMGGSAVAIWRGSLYRYINF